MGKRQNGRQLAGVTNTGLAASYSYNTSGIRISKTVNGTTTNYTLAGSQVVKATTGNDYVLYFYDSEGAPIFFRTVANNVSADYYYVKNLQGDIVAICDANGNIKVEYSYDAWGKVISISGTLASTIGQSNPYRYRGYWFDTETGLYYLQSRYYDPQTGRFINADEFISTGQGLFRSNMFAYCENNPVNGIDTNGHCFILALMTAAAIGSVIGGLTSYASYLFGCAVNGQSPTDDGAAEAVLKGMFYGALGGMISLPEVVVTTKVVISFCSGVISAEDRYRNDSLNLSVKERKANAALSFVVTSTFTYLGSLSNAFNPSSEEVLQSVEYSAGKYGIISAGVTAVDSVINNKRQNNKKKNLTIRIRPLSNPCLKIYRKKLLVY